MTTARIVGAVAATGVAATVMILVLRGRGVDHPAAADLEYVGRTACASCHAEQVERWSGSHHDLAMQEATSQSVLADFDDVAFTHRAITTTFTSTDSGFFVQTQGKDGLPAEIEVIYTFGVYPLQQYLVAAPGGRLQALNVAWDSRPPTDGGQRWFHLYPDVEVTPEDPLHWARPQQNWNRTCAECHSTNVERGFDLATQRYTTTWTDIDVSCEACHGPGSQHVSVAERVARGESQPASGGWGVIVNANDPGRRWTIRPGDSIASRDEPRMSDREIETCAHCHSRRTTLTENHAPGHTLLDDDILGLLREDLYYADGQILDEVYEYGSFVQSRMYRAGVTCSDCHDPHSLAVGAPGNALCSQCHLTSTYDSPSHHFHEEESAGAQCVDCHMPERTYMVVDQRRDHSLRIPRPDLSVTIGVPNACATCHTDRSNVWAAETVAAWYGPVERHPSHYGEAIDAGRSGDPAAESALAALVTDTSRPPIVRATALTLLSAYPGSFDLLQRGLADASPLVRLGTAMALGTVGEERVRAWAYPLLDDSVRSIRIEAVRVVATVPRANWTDEQRSTIDDAIPEYVDAQMTNADHPGSWVNLGDLYAALGVVEDARAAYETGITLDSTYLPARLNLADLLRATGRDDLGEDVLMAALETFPEAAEVHHAIGLLRVRQQDASTAIEWLERAVRFSPENARFAYVYGVALASAGEVERAIGVLEAALERHPYDRNIRDAIGAYRQQ
jgi:tetratricopeptide (TPR) repeat protein